MASLVASAWRKAGMVRKVLSACLPSSQPLQEKVGDGCLYVSLVCYLSLCHDHL